MKFSEMPYARPDLDELKQQLRADNHCLELS